MLLCDSLRGLTPSTCCTPRSRKPGSQPVPAARSGAGGEGAPMPPYPQGYKATHLGGQGSQKPSLRPTSPEVSPLQPTPCPRPVPCTLWGTSQTRAARWLCQLSLPSTQWLPAQPQRPPLHPLPSQGQESGSWTGLPLPCSGGSWGLVCSDTVESEDPGRQAMGVELWSRRRRACGRTYRSSCSRRGEGLWRILLWASA